MKASSNATQGILLMLAAVVLLSTMDALAKLLTTRFDVFQVVWARYAGQTLVAVVLLAPRLLSLLRTKHLGLQLLRSAFLFLATMCFFYSLSFMGLAEATAVMNLNPILLTLGAAAILGEKLGPFRIIGIAVALTGALIVIRPGSAVFSWVSLLPLVAGSFYAAYSLTTRFLGRDESVWTSFLYTALVGTLGASFLAPSVWTPPSASDWGLMLLLGCVGAAAQILLIKALTVSEAGLVAPFGYAGVIFAPIWGMVLFNATPDGATLLGSAVIVGAGLFIWARERANAKRAATAAAPPP